MSPIDYSKWDQLEVDSSDDAEGEPAVHQVVEASPEVVHFEHSGKPRSQAAPTVTRFTQPQKVHLGKVSGADDCQAHNEPSIPPPVAAKKPAPLNQSCTPEPPSTPPVREPNVGTVLLDGELSWEQSTTSVDLYLRLPFSEDRSRRVGKKDERQVKLIETEPPKALLGQRSAVPAALTAADPGSATAEDEKERLFPVAWGIDVTWPVKAKCPSELWAFNDNDNGNDLKATFSGYFPFPVTNIDETWNWEVLDHCPFVEKKEDIRYLHIELIKKQSQSLAGVSIWWDKLFLHHEAIDTSRRPGSDKRAAFAQVWKEAHDAFLEKMRRKRETDDRIIVTSDGCLIDPHNKGPDDDTAKPETP